MSIAKFEDLCRQFCETDGFPHPSLQHDDMGRLAFSVRVKGVRITALESRDIHADNANLIAEFGSLPAGYELVGWQALMDANLVMMDEDAPWFSRNQVTGQILLQWNCPLSEVSPDEVLRRVHQMADMALTWREESVIDTATVPAATRCTFPKINRSHRPWTPRGNRSQHAQFN
jgi:hypothetical protein